VKSVDWIEAYHWHLSKGHYTEPSVEGEGNIISFTYKMPGHTLDRDADWGDMVHNEGYYYCKFVLYSQVGASITADLVSGRAQSRWMGTSRWVLLL